MPKRASRMLELPQLRIFITSAQSERHVCAAEGERIRKHSSRREVDRLGDNAQTFANRVEFPDVHRDRSETFTNSERTNGCFERAGAGQRMAGLTFCAADAR